MARQPSIALFKKADMEGYLEKINSGIASKLMAGKTRVWCELYTTTLHIFKESKRSSSSSNPQQLDLTQVQTVRKSTSDKTGTQFEVLIKNKSHIFGASSVDDCNSWVRHLQHAMTLKDQDTRQTPKDTSEISIGGYETITMLPEESCAAPKFRIQGSAASASGYDEIGFQNTDTSAPNQPLPTDCDRNAAIVAEPDDDGKTEGKQRQDSKANDDYGYAEVEFRKSGSGQAALQEVHSTRKSLTSPALSAAPQPGSSEEEYGYATVEVKAKRDLCQRQPVLATPPGIKTEGSEEEDSYGYAKVNRQTTPPSTNSHNSRDSLRTAGDGASDDLSDDLSDEDEVYTNALSQADPDPIPPFPHPLGSDDEEPLAALQEFLSNNRKVCRLSFFDRTVVEDPVGDMKRLLQELHLSG